nr:PREDICTED: uncharacterized protein LOC108206554 isoform X1 [Daucus carota subsp. sativus]XP_017232380.1 PREDICTED: uncharacterized protein LOC108206554 isoform X1 [Daucus carota subsp. sativus]
MKGAMVCPNCRNTEGGNWLCADGPDPSLSDSSIDYGTFAEHTYQFLVAEDQPSGHRRLPLSGLTGGHSSFEQVEFTLGFPGVRRFTSPMGFPRLAPGLHSATPPQGGSNISPHLDGQNLHEENRGHLSHFPIRLSHINSGRGSQGQASGGADPGHRSGNFWPL